MTHESHEITSLLNAVSSGAAGAWEPLLELIYRELSMLAGKQMRRERRGHTFQRTALVNEAYIRLVGGKPGNWENRAHFFAAAAEAMRRILVDYSRQRLIREGELGHVSINLIPGEGSAPGKAGSQTSSQASSDALDADTEALDAALSKMEADEDRKDICTTVKLRFFVGLSIEETAQALGKSVAKVKRDWHFAKAWLYHEMKRQNDETQKSQKAEKPKR